MAKNSLNNQITFYRCQVWKNQLGFTGRHRYASMPPDKCYEAIKICSLHFTDDSFMTLLKDRLKCNAVPTLFLSRATTSKLFF